MFSEPGAELNVKSVVEPSPVNCWLTADVPSCTEAVVICTAIFLPDAGAVSKVNTALFKT